VVDCSQGTEFDTLRTGDKLDRIAQAVDASYWGGPESSTLRFLIDGCARAWEGTRDIPRLKGIGSAFSSAGAFPVVGGGAGNVIAGRRAGALEGAPGAGGDDIAAGSGVDPEESARETGDVGGSVPGNGDGDEVGVRLDADAVRGDVDAHGADDGAAGGGRNQQEQEQQQQQHRGEGWRRGNPGHGFDFALAGEGGGGEEREELVSELTASWAMR
jgi:hypothetical protein